MGTRQSELKLLALLDVMKAIKRENLNIVIISGDNYLSSYYQKFISDEIDNVDCIGNYNLWKELSYYLEKHKISFKENLNQWGVERDLSDLVWDEISIISQKYGKRTNYKVPDFKPIIKLEDSTDISNRNTRMLSGNGAQFWDLD